MILKVKLLVFTNKFRQTKICQLHIISNLGFEREIQHFIDKMAKKIYNNNCTMMLGAKEAYILLDDQKKNACPLQIT